MKVKIIAKDVHFSMPVPMAMIGFVVKLITKETVSMILSECLDVLKENKGLEVIHVEASDETFVSITL